MDNANTSKPMNVYILAGEGDEGHSRYYEGKLTARALKMRLTKERCDGDRWATIKYGYAAGDWQDATPEQIEAMAKAGLVE